METDSGSATGLPHRGPGHRLPCQADGPPSAPSGEGPCGTGPRPSDEGPILPPPWAWHGAPATVSLRVGDLLLPPEATCVRLIEQLEPNAVAGPMASLFQSAAPLPDGPLYTTPDAAGLMELCRHLHHERGRGDLCVLALGLSGSQSQVLTQQLAQLGADIAVVFANMIQTPNGQLDPTSLALRLPVLGSQDHADRHRVRDHWTHPEGSMDSP